MGKQRIGAQQEICSITIGQPPPPSQSPVGPVPSV